MKHIFTFLTTIVLFMGLPMHSAPLFASDEIWICGTALMEEMFQRVMYRAGIVVICVLLAAIGYIIYKVIAWREITVPYAENEDERHR